MFIDIGSPAIDRNWYFNPVTIVDKNKSANASGKITSVEIWAVQFYSLLNCEVAIFYITSGDNFSTRSTHAIGTVAHGSKQIFEVDLDVEEGDYIGIYFTSGRIERTGSGGDVGVLYATGDHIPCTDKTFTPAANNIISLYGTGETIPGIKDTARTGIYSFKTLKI